MRALCGVHFMDRKSYGFDVGLKLNNGSVGYGKQCVLVWSCAEDEDRHI